MITPESSAPETLQEESSLPPSARTPNVGALEMDEIEPTEPWRPLVVPGIIVVIGLCIAWAFFAYFGRSKPDASASLLRQYVYQVQVDSGASPQGPGMPGALPEQDETVVLVQARVNNISKYPLTLFDLVSDVKMPGQSSGDESSAALPEDIDRFMQRFPQLTAMNMAPLTRHTVIPPGGSVEGLMVFAYPWTKAQWTQRKSGQVIISFQHGRSVALPLQ
ncbi:MAG TPA: hypothetical protein VMF56_16305 [Acidobacteriaceae bacterium]|nr:hypothetical protein [Acidobacteriaceae bacterium]